MTPASSAMRAAYISIWAPRRRCVSRRWETRQFPAGWAFVWPMICTRSSGNPLSAPTASRPARGQATRNTPSTRPPVCVTSGTGTITSIPASRAMSSATAWEKVRRVPLRTRGYWSPTRTWAGRKTPSPETTWATTMGALQKLVKNTTSFIIATPTAGSSPGRPAPTS